MPRLTLKKGATAITDDFEQFETVADVLRRLSDLSESLGRSSLSLSPTGSPLPASTLLSDIPKNSNSDILLYLLSPGSPPPAQRTRTPGIVIEEAPPMNANRFASIKVYPSLESSPNQWLLDVPSESLVKWHWRRIELFLRQVSSRYEEGKYKLFDKLSRIEIPITEALYLSAGRYAIVPVDQFTLPLVVDQQRFDIVPSQAPAQDEDRIQKQTEFRERIIARDNQCECRNKERTQS